jgi:hypothetical protein
MDSHADLAGNPDPLLRARMRDGRLTQILTLVDRIEHHLDDVTELVARLQRDSTRQETAIRDGQLARDRSVTSGCWPMPSAQEDSASL